MYTCSEVQISENATVVCIEPDREEQFIDSLGVVVVPQGWFKETDRPILLILEKKISKD